MMSDIPALPKLHHIQVKLTPEEYQLFSHLAHVALKDRTPYARELFVNAMKKERARLGLPETSRKHSLK